MAAVLSSIFDALTLTNTLYFEWVGVRDFMNDRCVRDYDWPEFPDLEEYVRIEVDKLGNIEEVLEVGSDERKIKPKKAVKTKRKVLPALQEVDETEQEESAVPNHIIM